MDSVPELSNSLPRDRERGSDYNLVVLVGAVVSQGVTSQQVASQGVTNQGTASQGVTSQEVASQGLIFLWGLCAG